MSTIGRFVITSPRFCSLGLLAPCCFSQILRICFRLNRILCNIRCILLSSCRILCSHLIQECRYCHRWRSIFMNILSISFHPSSIFCTQYLMGLLNFLEKKHKHHPLSHILYSILSKDHLHCKIYSRLRQACKYQFYQKPIWLNTLNKFDFPNPIFCTQYLKVVSCFEGSQHILPSISYSLDSRSNKIHRNYPKFCKNRWLGCKFLMDQSKPFLRISSNFFHSIQNSKYQL